MIRQLTVFVPNQPGMLARLSALLGKAGIQVIGFMAVDSADFSIVRIVCDHTDSALTTLQEAGYNVQLTQVLALPVNDTPGGLAYIMSRLASEDLNVNYCYSASAGNQVVDIIQVSGDPVEVKVAQSGLKGLTETELEQLCS